LGIGTLARLGDITLKSRLESTAPENKSKAKPAGKPAEYPSWVMVDANIFFVA